MMKFNLNIEMTESSHDSFFKTIAIIFIVIGVVISLYFLTKNNYNIKGLFENKEIEASPTYSNLIQNNGIP